MSSEIFLLEPFYSGSHAQWANELKRFSKNRVSLFTLPGKHWKWRMASSAIPLALMVNDDGRIPDSFLVSGMIDLSLFKSLISKRMSSVPVILYMHENQLTYPWNEAANKNRDRQYAWRNLTSMLVADKVVFNSAYHMEEVLSAIPEFLKAFPDKGYSSSFVNLRQKCSVLSPGIDFEFIRSAPQSISSKPRILWNHRWEHDKNPEEFYQLIKSLAEDGCDFELIICGEHYKDYPVVFNAIKSEFENQIVHFGYAENRQNYVELLRSSHVLPVTSVQEFFGLSVMEAAIAGVHILLPERLSYPSIYSGLNVFYQKRDELILQTKQVLSNPKRFKLPPEFDQYDWKNLIEHYDTIFSNPK